MGEDIKPLLILSIAETEEKEKKEEKKLLLELSRKILELVEKESIIHPPRLLTGKDLLQMGFQPGKYMGQILKEIMQLQIEGVIKNREEAIEYVKKNYSPLQES
jgi:tRNA nucleotidyltransferase/poly(A) polymerase